jgi:hypothetical protein
MIKEPQPVATRWTEENIVDLIRKVRNDLIKDFLDERFLAQYLSQHFRVRELSHVKIEFIKNDLKDMLISPVNIQHYQIIIQQIKETDSASLSEGNEALFYKDIETLLKKYIY